MHPIARALLSTPAARPAIYTPPGVGEPVTVRVILNDVPGDVRRESGEDLQSDDAVAIIADTVPAAKGGRLLIQGSLYQLGQPEPYQVPGLTAWPVVRLSGPGIELFDLSRQLMAGFTETVVLDGRPLEAVVARRADTIEVDETGAEVLTQRNRVAIPQAELNGSGVGSSLRLDGEDLLISAVRRTGAGIVTLIC